jgi:hypothetical protein
MVTVEPIQPRVGLSLGPAGVTIMAKLDDLRSARDPRTREPSLLVDGTDHMLLGSACMQVRKSYIRHVRRSSKTKRTSTYLTQYASLTYMLCWFANFFRLSIFLRPCLCMEVRLWGSDLWG